jgi:hypothetical protein
VTILSLTVIRTIRLADQDIIGKVTSKHRLRGVAAIADLGDDALQADAAGVGEHSMEFPRLSLRESGDVRSRVAKSPKNES